MSPTVLRRHPAPVERPGRRADVDPAVKGPLSRPGRSRFAPYGAPNREAPEPKSGWLRRLAVAGRGPGGKRRMCGGGPQPGMSRGTRLPDRVRPRGGGAWRWGGRKRSRQGDRAGSTAFLAVWRQQCPGRGKRRPGERGRCVVDDMDGSWARDNKPWGRASSFHQFMATPFMMSFG